MFCFRGIIDNTPTKANPYASVMVSCLLIQLMLHLSRLHLSRWLCLWVYSFVSLSVFMITAQLMNSSMNQEMLVFMQKKIKQKAPLSPPASNCSIAYCTAITGRILLKLGTCMQ